MINVYGCPQGALDLWKSQNTLWKEMFSHVAGLGDVPWAMAGDWNVTPDQLDARACPTDFRMAS